MVKNRTKHIVMSFSFLIDIFPLVDDSIDTLSVS